MSEAKKQPVLAEDEFRNRLTLPQHRQLYDYWNMLREDRAMPARNDLDPTDIPDLLPNLVLLDVEQGKPMRYRLRLQGTAVSARYGEHTGQYLDETGLGKAYAEIAGIYEESARNGQPHVSETGYWTETQSYVRIARLVLPFSNDGKTTNILLAGLYFLNQADQETRLGL